MTRFVEMSDEELVKLLHECNDETMDEFVSRYEKAVFTTAIAVVKDYSSAKDVAQETFVKFWRKGKRGSIRPGPVGPILHKIAKGSAMEFNRGAGRERVKIEKLSQYKHTAVSESADGYPELDSHIQHAISKLSVPVREVLLLSWYGEMEDVEIAKFLDIPIGTVKSRLHSARLKLGKLLRKL
jgi:RNA polymerase sigma-70 factor (ECF subfamily)